MLEGRFDGRHGISATACWSAASSDLGMVLELEILLERCGKLVVHRQVVFERRNVFERTGDGIVEIIVEGRLRRLARVRSADRPAERQPCSSVPRHRRRWKSSFERSGKIVVHRVSGRRFESRLMKPRTSRSVARCRQRRIRPSTPFRGRCRNRPRPRLSAGSGSTAGACGLTGWRGSKPMILVSSANGSSSAMSLRSATLSWVLSAIIVPELALIRTPWTSRRVGPYQRNVGKR